MNNIFQHCRSGMLSSRFRRTVFSCLWIQLLLPAMVMSQKKPEFKPPIGALPRGPLTPVRRIAIDSAYLMCNYLQLQSARRIVWQPVLQSMGANEKDTDAYAWALDNASTEVCAGRRGSELSSRAFATMTKVMDGLEDLTFGSRSLLTRNEKVQMSDALLKAAYDEFQSRCFDSRVDEAQLMLGRLPKTPDVGLGVPAQPATAALGRCRDRDSGSMTGIAGTFNGSEFSNCAAKSLRNATQECTDPAGQDRPSGGGRRSAPPPPIVGDSGWRRDPSTGNYTRVFRTNAPDGSHTNVTQIQNPDGSVLTRTLYFAPGQSGAGHEYRETFYIEQGGTGKEFEITWGPTQDQPALERSTPAEVRAARRQMDRIRQIRQEDWDEYNAAVQAALHVSPPLPNPPRAPEDEESRDRECQAMTLSSQGAMGLFQLPSGNPSDHRVKWISGSDLVLSCLCTLGAKGAQLANQIAVSIGEPKVSCSNNEWLRRVDCVSNPRGSADQIRPECLAYLREDYQFDSPTTACEAALQCPEGSHPIPVGTGSATACTCSHSGGGLLGGRTGSRNNCAAVRCPPPGTPSRDPMVQACCGGPAGGPSDIRMPPLGPVSPESPPIPKPPRPPE